MSDPQHPPSRDILHALPKIDLHVHIDGAVQPATILDLAREQGASLPADTPESLAPFVTVGPGCRSLSEFLKVFEVFYPLLKNPAAVERIAYEFCEMEAADNAVYVEARFAPALQAGPAGDIFTVTEAALRGLERGTRDFGLRTGLILCCYRTEPPASSVETVEAAVALRHRGVVAVDLAGDETRFKGSDHLEAFRLALRHGLPVTVHAGEVVGPDSIQEALFLLGARRIGHGVRLIEDPDLRTHVAREGVAVETCLTSNLQTGAWPDLATHPFATFLREGIRVTLNTDDPVVCRTTLTDELVLASATFGLGRDDILALTRNAARAAFLDTEDSRTLCETVERRFHDAWTD